MGSSDSFVVASAFAVLLILCAGCGEGGADAVMKAATSSGVNGYISAQGHKFYTGEGVFAEKCPVSGTMDLEEVVGYVPEAWTPGDTNIVIAPVSLGAVKSPWSGEIYRKIILPDKDQLESWGAVFAEESSVKIVR
jgi:hypothetical protein